MTARDLIHAVCAALVARGFPAVVQHHRLYLRGSLRHVAFVNPSEALVVSPVYASESSDDIVHRAWNPKRTDSADAIAETIIARLATAKAGVAA